VRKLLFRAKTLDQNANYRVRSNFERSQALKFKRKV